MRLAIAWFMLATAVLFAVGVSIGYEEGVKDAAHHCKEIVEVPV